MNDRFLRSVILCALTLIGAEPSFAQEGTLNPRPPAQEVPLLMGGRPPSLHHALLIPVPQQFTTPMGLFCKLDVELERALRMPVVVRLGDALQVDAWEGKGPYRSTAPLRP